MIQTPEERSAQKARLQAVPCAECGHPVAHMDAKVPGALAGGMCTRCRKDASDRPRRVYTYVRLVQPAADS